MINFYYKTAKEEEFSSLPSAKEGCWIHIEEATTEDLLLLCELTGLEMSDIQDALDRYEVPRIEKIHHCVLLYTRHPIEVDNSLFTTTLTIVATPHYFITITPSKDHLIKDFLSKKSKMSYSNRLKIVIQILLKITQEFTIQIKKVRHNVLTKQKEMIHVGSEDISELTRHEEILNQYHSSIVPLRAVLENLLSGKFLALHEKDQEHIEDVWNALKQSEDLAAIVTKTIRSLRDSYQIIFTNNLNKTIKLLTALTIIFSIPTMIASLYGMNVSLPFAEFRHMFAILLSLIIVFSIVCFILFRRRGWL